MQDSFFEAEGNNSGVLSNVPAALSRWTEEARVLDADSMHDCITGWWSLHLNVRDRKIILAFFISTLDGVLLLA